MRMAITTSSIAGRTYVHFRGEEFYPAEVERVIIELDEVLEVAVVAFLMSSGARLVARLLFLRQGVVDLPTATCHRTLPF